jgi:molybdopterin-guanine dinucleotide biosynthesis protein A
MALSQQIRSQIGGLVLAGGRATRMGGVDKGLLTLAGKAMAWHVVQALRPQVSDLFINANRNLEQYRELGHPVVTDLMGDFPGPLAGMASGMRVAKTPYLLTAPCDSPFVPADLAERLHSALAGKNAEISVAGNQGRLEPVFALLDCRLLPSLLEYLNSGGRKIDRWYAQHRMAAVDFSDNPRAFLNLNTPEELAAVELELKCAQAMRQAV